MSDDAKHPGQQHPHGPAAAADDTAAPHPATPNPDPVGSHASQIPPASAGHTAAAAEGPSTATGTVAVLEARVRELEQQQADLTDRMLRAHAEMDNLRKRTEKEKADALKYSITKFAQDIVGISDNFQRAAAAVPQHALDQDATLKAVVEGVVMTERAFVQVLERHGVKRQDPTGQQFDPNLHQAVTEQHDATVVSGTVLQCFQIGYMIHDRVLRPAMVSVARGGSRPVKPATDTGHAAPAAANENDTDRPGPADDGSDAR